MYDNVNNGIIIFGDNHGNINYSNNQSNNTKIRVTINDTQQISELLSVISSIQTTNSKEKEKIDAIKTELESGNAKVGKIQAAYDWLRRNCTYENTLKTLEVFGSLLIKAITLL